MIPAAGGYSLDNKQSTENKASAESESSQRSGAGQRGIFVNVATGGSKLTPTYSASEGMNPWMIAGAAAVGLVGIWLFKRK